MDNVTGFAVVRKLISLIIMKGITDTLPVIGMYAILQALTGWGVSVLIVALAIFLINVSMMIVSYSKYR